MIVAGAGGGGGGSPAFGDTNGGAAGGSGSPTSGCGGTTGVGCGGGGGAAMHGGSGGAGDTADDCSAGGGGMLGLGGAGGGGPAAGSVCAGGGGAGGGVYGGGGGGAGGTATFDYAGGGGGGSSGFGSGTTHTSVAADTTGTPSITFTFTVHQPDAQIKLAGDTSYLGAGVFNLTGAGQTRTTTVAPGKSTTFDLLFANAGSVPDSITVLGCSGSSTFKPQYLHGKTNVTSAVTAGSYTSGTLAVGASQVLKLKMAVSSAAAAGKVFTCAVVASSQAAPSHRDVVKAKVKVG